MKNSGTYYIETDSELKGFCDELSGADWIGVDTEFLRERTYYPRPCLLQLSGTTGIACIDLVSIRDLSPLCELLFRPGLVKLMHACGQDLEIFYLLFDQIPANIFDTQVAAAFTGFGDQVSYAALVDSILDIHLPKAHTRARWCERPLAEAEIHYAEDDVRYLHDLYADLTARLEKAGRTAWFHEEMLRYTDKSTFFVADDEAWLRLGALQQMTGRPLAAAKALAGWRENLAKRRDKPRSWILTDAVLLKLANSLPADREALAQVEGVTGGLLKHRGNELLKIVASTLEHNESSQPAGPGRPDAKQKALRKELAGLLDAKAAELGLPASILATRRDLMAMVQGSREPAVMHGWRAAIIGDELRQRLQDRQLEQQGNMA